MAVTTKPPVRFVPSRAAPDFYLVSAFSSNTLHKLSRATKGPSCDHMQLVSSLTLAHKASFPCLYFLNHETELGSQQELQGKVDSLYCPKLLNLVV